MPDSTARPGHHVTIGPEKAMEARRAGLQLRDTILVLEPGPRVRLVMLFRAPLDGTVASNVLTHGEGGLDIDGCRVDVGTPRNNPSEVKVGGGKEQPNIYEGFRQIYPMGGGRVWTLGGRWPTNLLLVHGPRCTCKGIKQVRGCNPVSPSGQVTPKAYANRRRVYSAIADRPVTSHVDAEGMEAVPAWECLQGCSVKALDSMGGDPSGSDRGGASRFYPQFTSASDVGLWLAKLMGHGVVKA